MKKKRIKKIIIRIFFFLIMIIGAGLLGYGFDYNKAMIGIPGVVILIIGGCYVLSSIE